MAGNSCTFSDPSLWFLSPMSVEPKFPTERLPLAYMPLETVNVSGNNIRLLAQRFHHDSLRHCRYTIRYSIKDIKFVSLLGAVVGLEVQRVDHVLEPRADRVNPFTKYQEQRRLKLCWAWRSKRYPPRDTT